MVVGVSRTVLGPLTATFTAPADCSVFAYGGPDQTTGAFFQGQSCRDGTLQDAATCWPSATLSAPNPPLDGWGLYSPGLYCPDGYESACASTAQPTGQPGAATAYPFQFPLTAGETAIGCCPSGMWCDAGSAYQRCISVLTTGTLFSAGYCGSGTGFIQIAKVTIGATEPNGTAGRTTAAVIAPLIQRVFREIDLSALPISTPSQTSQDNGLSTSTKIGIGIGVPLAVFLVALFGICVFFHRRKAVRKQQYVDLAELSGSQNAKPILSHQEPFELATTFLHSTTSAAYIQGSREQNSTMLQQTSELSAPTEK